MAKSTIDASIDRIIKAAASQGFSPDHDMTRTVPDGFLVKGVSTYYDKDGKLTGQWVKSAVDPERQREIIREAFAGFIEDASPLAAPPAPLDFQSEVIPWIQIGDAHLGMLDHANEAGEHFDLKIAEQDYPPRSAS